MNVEEENNVIYGITDENGFYLDFTTDERTAVRLADFLNENKVEACHVSEIIEDIFYSCGDRNVVLFFDKEQ